MDGLPADTLLHSPSLHSNRTMSDNPDSSQGLRDPRLRPPLKDGISTAVMTGSGESYVSALAVFLGATPVQISIFATLPQLLGAIFQSSGVWLMERVQSRRKLLSRLARLQALVWFVLALVVVLRAGDSTAFYGALILVTAHFLLSGVIGPVWNSLIGDIVPPTTRGRFFGHRNKLMVPATFISLLAAGRILEWSSGWSRAHVGFAVIFIIAAVARYPASRWLNRYPDPPFQITAHDKFSFFEFILRAPQSNFVRFVVFVGGINFAVNIGAPFFAVYMLRELNLSYASYTLVIAAAVVSQFFTVRYWGEIADRFANKFVLTVTACLLSITPFLWLFGTAVPYLIFLQLYSGFVWAGFNLAASNFLFDAVSPAKRGRCVAYQGVINGTAVCCGSLLGGYVATHPLPLLPWSPYLSLFFISGMFRVLAVVCFAPWFKEVREIQPKDRARLIYRIAMFRPLSGSVFVPIVEREPETEPPSHEDSAQTEERSPSNDAERRGQPITPDGYET